MPKSYEDGSRPTVVRARLAFNLRRIRGMVGVSQERLALEAGVDRTMLSKIERELTNPSLDTLVKLASRLDVDVSVLLAPEESSGCGCL